MGWLDSSINRQRDYIISVLSEPMSELAIACEQCWHDREALDAALKSYLENKPEHRCRLVYVIDTEGNQHSSNVSDEIIDDAIIGQNLAQRPYLQLLRKQTRGRTFLSEVYIDKQTRKPCITALHVVAHDGVELGYLAADFGLKDLPLQEIETAPELPWRQIKGDPSIRGSLFNQTRTVSDMDRRIVDVLDVVETLVTEQGIFHVKLHFSSSRATLWPFNDPYRYRLHVLDEILSPEVCLAYARREYPKDANIPHYAVRAILKGFRLLREADENIYLRAASLNIMNGQVGLNFSCDGTHYMTADDFLEKDLDFWFGKNANAACTS